ncbi:MAG TPA: PASTA domain-containing protein, partial [Candidatus Acidoferrum sp.]|nr:PASTA domain-containing protein [Candidatus Acidoferrum sp.]
VERALAKDPADRFRDCEEMAEVLHEARTETERAAATARTARRPNGSSPGGGGTPLQGVADGELSTAATAIVGPGAHAQRAVVDEAKATVARTRRYSGGDGQAPPPSSPSGGHGRRRRGFIASLAVLPLIAVALGAAVLVGQRAHTNVPELRGLRLGGVVARARRLHVRPAFSRRHSDAARGTAIAQRPAPGTRVVNGTTVHVVLSAGPPPVTVPSVVGQPAPGAESQIAHAGLRYSTSTVVAPESEAGVVVRQSPGPASSAPRGSTVALSVSETPRWRPLTTFSGVDDGHSVAFRILGRRWRVSYSMGFRGTCEFLVVCGGPHAEVLNLDNDSAFGGFDLEEGESQTHVVDSGPGLYRLQVSGGRDSARWSMTVEDLY